MHNQSSSFDDRTHLLALAFTRRVGRVLIERLLNEFDSLEAVLTANETELRRVQGIGQQIAKTIASINLSKVAADLVRFTEQNITVATYTDKYYPSLLNVIEDKPLAVFWKGAILEEDLQSIAIVGTREGQSESIELAERLGFKLALLGWTVVSGLARGIDQAAHEGAIRAAAAGSGRTMAVLGCGVNVIYPPENSTLAEQIHCQRCANLRTTS
jgi:DNA processing protein